MPRGFILQPTYRLESGRPVVHLFGILESGGSFLVRDDRTVPHFWILRFDADRARGAGALDQHDDPGRVTMQGEPVVRVEIRRPADTPPLRDRLTAMGVRCFEADVRFAYRYLIDRRIRGTLEIDGESTPGDGIDMVFENPEVRPADWAPSLKVLSIDIETDPRASRVLSVALAGCGAAEVLLLTPEGYDCPEGAVACRDEAEVLRMLVRRVRELDPDIITGWNVVGFDLAVLDRIAAHHGVPLALGRGYAPLRFRPSRTPRASRDAVLSGRLVLDGIDLLRGAFVKLDDYSLNTAAREIVGKQKTMTGPNRVWEIVQSFKRDRPRFVEYNLHDARLVLDILDELKLIELSVERSRLTGLPPDRVAGSVAAFDFLYLSSLAQRRIVAPIVRDVPGLASQSGGYVLEPHPGLYRNVLMLDFRSLYPSIIRTFQIDPLGHLPRPVDDDDPIVAPNGAAFSRAPGVLPAMLDELLPRRTAAIASGDHVASHAIKILMNSCYGVLGTPACRFASPALVNAITGFGREILLWSKARVESAGLTVVYGDTDSLFVLTGEHEADAARALGTMLVADLNADLADHVRERWRVESRLELMFERLYLRLLLPAVRHGTAGARKRYAGLVDGAPGAEPTVEFTGLEVVRRDWTALARGVQRELYERLFFDRPVEEHLRSVVQEVRSGKRDDELVYRKGLRRKLESYTSTTPPHVAAARKMTTRPGRVIRYVMTRNGPEPAAERRSPIDHEHYVQKQVRAVAEPVLTLLGLDFDRVVGDEKQMTLF